MRLDAIIKACVYIGGVVLLVLLFTMCSFEFTDTNDRRAASATDADHQARLAPSAASVPRCPSPGAPAPALHA